MSAVMSKLSLQERVRARLREWCKDLTHQRIADHLHVNRSSVSKLFQEGGPALTLDHLEAFQFLIQRSVAEMVTAPDSLLQEIKPLEAQLLATFRAMTELQRHSLLAVLDRSAQEPRSKRRARLGRMELTEEQQLLVDLYARSNEQARSGILQTLRGAARVGDVERNRHRTTE